MLDASDIVGAAGVVAGVFVAGYLLARGLVWLMGYGDSE